MLSLVAAFFINEAPSLLYRFSRSSSILSRRDGVFTRFSRGNSQLSGVDIDENAAEAAIMKPYFNALLNYIIILKQQSSRWISLTYKKIYKINTMTEFTFQSATTTK
eukprot:m.67289 g.67289  ORF g.67289 m.67289 type:complete len:107 (+) comp11876_c0_seq1:777-1097(+)